MKEKLKSVLLFILVVGSLVQTYMLAYGKAYYEWVEDTEYIQPELIGTRLEAQELIYPNDIVLHLADGEHVILHPKNVFYKEIFEKISVRSFGGFREIDRRSVDWELMREQYRGVEIRFDEQVPASILNTIMQIEGGFPDEHETFSKIWITTNESGEEVRTFFFNTQDNTIYEVTRADLTSKDVEQFVGFGVQYLPKYTTLPVGSSGNVLYLPKMDLDMVQIRLRYDTFTAEQLQNNLFVNPGITRKLMERDGTEIYTDGKRGLQIYHDREWISYSDPIAPAETATDRPNRLLAAVQFVNQHGGWNGNFRIERYATLSNEEYIFRQYFGQYPIVDLHQQPFGLIRVVMNNDIVNLYERSKILLESGIAREEARLVGGEQLLDIVLGHDRLVVMQDIYPAYRPMLHEDYIELVPVWVVKYTNGTKEYLY